MKQGNKANKGKNFTIDDMVEDEKITHKKQYGGVSIWFPFFGFSEDEKFICDNVEFHQSGAALYPINDYRDSTVDDVYYPIHIKTTEERVDNLFEYIECCNMNFWICEEYSALNDAISEYAAKIVLGSKTYFRNLSERLLNSPYGMEYKPLIDFVYSRKRNVEDKESVECIKYILQKSGGYRIEIWDSVSDKPCAHYPIIDDVDCDLIVE